MLMLISGAFHAILTEVDDEKMIFQIFNILTLFPTF